MHGIKSFVFVIFLLGAWCGGESKTEAIKSGRLQFVKTLRYGSVGTHGSKGWYVSNRRFIVNGKSWSPENIDVNEDISGCEASPNDKVEVLKCTSFARLKESVYILRMNGEKAEWITASDAEYDRGSNLGAWTNEGRWLLFRKYLFNVETSEKKLVRSLPEDPEKYFRTASPNLKTIVYREQSFVVRDDLPQGAAREEEMKRQWRLADEHLAKNIAAFWMIDAETGAVEIFEIEKDKFDWLDWDQNRFPGYREWLTFFQKHFVWEKDRNGKYKLVVPANL